MKKISIIIPCYNCENTIDRCLSSVLGQTYSNTEVILIDDGSTDSTEKIIADYQKQYPNIKYFKLDHKGVSNARNFGLSVATGDYIQFADSDDNFMSSEVLSTAVNTLESKHVDICVYNFTHPCFEMYLPEGYYDLTDKNTFLTYYQDFFASMMPWNKLFRREVLTEKYIVGVAFAEDELFNLANLKNVKSVYILDKVFYNYYCATPGTIGENVSAINSSFSGDNFTRTQNTIWYRGRNNCVYRQQILKCNYPELADRMLAIRIFDFFFWNLEFIGHIGAAPEVLSVEIDRIFRESEHIFSINSKTKFGIKLKTLSTECMKKNIAKFSELALKCYRTLKSSKLGLNVYFVLMDLFAKFFCEYSPEALDTSDVFAKAIVECELNDTKEANFINTSLIGAYND